jgi:hypothetical protein
MHNLDSPGSSQTHVGALVADGKRSGMIVAFHAVVCSFSATFSNVTFSLMMAF